MAVLQPTVTNISLPTPQPIVGSVIVSSNTTNTTFYSSKILNYIESIDVNGVLKSVFYTEVNTNVNVGDRIFIVNGVYDSDKVIIKDKYSKFSDGYRVLSVDGCRIVLDINYTGDLPYKKFTTKDFINVHNITTQKDFDYINSINISANGEKPLKNVFSGNIGDKGTLFLDSQNILFVSVPFSGSSDPSNIYGDVKYAGFWVRVDDGINNEWIDVTQQFISNNLTNRNLSLSGDVYIIGENFIYDGQEFLQGGIYKYENYGWVFDITYYQPYLSKVNFRSGKFKGIHNDGIFGTYKKRNIWSDSEWNSGVFINSLWKNGSMNSKHTIDELSYNCVLKIIGSVSQVLQSVDLTNNKGYGYNFIEDSTFENFVINNGNFKNCNLISNDPNNYAIDNFYNGTNQFKNLVNGGKFDMCDVSQIKSSGGYFLNSSVRNSNLFKSKLVSSESTDTTVDGGYWSNEGGIKILGADIWAYDFNEGSVLGTNQNDIRGTLKIYISEEDFFKLSIGDTFYISRINKDKIFNLLTEEQKILFPLENRFIIDNYFDYTLNKNVKNDIKVSLKSSNENRYKTLVTISPNQVPNYEDVIDGDNLDYWYKLPSYSTDPNVPSFRGLYELSYDNDPTTNGYYLGDFVFEQDLIDPNLLNFYLFWPIDRNTGVRAENVTEALNFVVRGQGTQPDVNGYSDWIFVGTFSGIWGTSGSYEGYYIDEEPPPNYKPKYPVGNVIGDYPEILFCTKFWIFVGTSNPTLPLTNKSKQLLISVDYLSRNEILTSNFNLPSIDISSNIFGWYTNQNDEKVYTNSYILSPISVDNVNDVLVGNVLGNGDFKSGVFANSTWISGDNVNYVQNEFEPTDFSLINGRLVPSSYKILLDTIQGGKRVLRISTNLKKFSNYNFDGYDFNLGDYIWINALDYVQNNTSYNLDGRYRIVDILKDEIKVVSDEINDPLALLTIGGKYQTPSAKSNKYFSFSKFVIKNSKIQSGKFTKTSFDNCTFQNDIFQKYVYPTKDLANTEIIRLVNILFNRNNNVVRSGLVYKSHFVDGIFDGGTFYDSFWMGNDFTDGLFKYSVWMGGNFNGGKFVDSKDSAFFIFDFDYSKTTRLWQDGNFNNGEFYNSLWVRGIFNNGRFYKSDWTGGTWNDGILGSKNLRSNETSFSVYGPTTSFGTTYSIWNNGVVENAIVGGDGYVDWYNGKFLSGIFTSNGRTNKTKSVWYNGEFYGSSFTGQAWWKNGKFFSGKFLSEVGWTSVSFTTHSNDPYNYGWVTGDFYSGEFGSGTASGPNSLWYSGTFHDGTFLGKFWRDGLLIDGNFYGNFVNNGEISENLPRYLTNFYGMWQDGQVNDTLYDVKRDIIVADTNKNKPRNRVSRLNFGPSFNGVIWKNGTFSHSYGTIDNSVWLNGNFNNGNFNNSIFNPFIDLNLSGLSVTDYKRLNYLELLADEIRKIVPTNPLNPKRYLDRVISVIQYFDGNSDYDLELAIDFYLQYSITPITDFNSINYNFTYDDVRFDPQTITILRVKDQRLFEKDQSRFITVSIIYLVSNFTYNVFFDTSTIKAIPFKFEERDTCIWTNGNFNNSEFYYSKWLSGNFNDGTMSGGIWLDGVFEYGSMYNCYWENGIWRNGNWYGAPFDYTSLNDIGQNFIISDKKTLDLITNIFNYTNLTYLFLTNVVVLEDVEKSVHTFNPINGFLSWTYSTNE